MTSFKSRYYPRSGQKVAVFQEYAVKYYAMVFMVFLFFIMLQVLRGKEILFTAIAGAIFCLILGNILAYGGLKRHIAEIFFVNDSLTVISVYDILFQLPGRSFPLRFVNPFRTGNEIQFTYEDQLRIIKKEDWPEFELVWNWLNHAPAQEMTIQGFREEETGKEE